MTKQTSEILSFYDELIFHNGIEKLKLDFENWDEYQKQGYTYYGLNIYNYEQGGHYMSYTLHPQWSPPNGSDFSIHFHIHLGDWSYYI